MPGSMSAYRYVGDNGTNYAVRLADNIASAAGFGAAQPGDVTKPSRFTMRHVIASWFSAGGAGQAVGKFTRSVPVPSLTSPLWTGATADLSLPDYNSTPGAGQTTPNVMRTFTITGWAGERRTKT
jgi:hypothetical protein